ncbi:hypothetical protein BDY24DRAFT_412344 [Mrakia frigida]|uniref:uncharacterized protein n=1 Tax=Mrakia frigida TaxID=29902 RepID=UPI003FCBFB08
MDDFLPPRPSPSDHRSRNGLFPPASASRTRSATSPRSTPTRSSTTSRRDQPSAAPAPALVLRLAPMDELDHLLLFLPPALLPSLIQQLRRIDQAQGRLLETQERRVREGRWRRMVGEMETEARRKRESQFQPVPAAAPLSPPASTSTSTQQPTQSPDLSLTPPSPENSPHRRPEARILVPGSGSPLVPPTSTPPPLPPVENNNNDNNNAKPLVPSSSTSSPPKPQPNSFSPTSTPTLKTLFVGLRSLRSQLDELDLDLDAPVEDTRRRCEELLVEVKELDWLTTGPKFKNWRRERKVFGEVLGRVWGREEQEGEEEETTRPSLERRGSKVGSDCRKEEGEGVVVQLEQLSMGGREGGSNEVEEKKNDNDNKHGRPSSSSSSSPSSSSIEIPVLQLPSFINNTNSVNIGSPPQFQPQHSGNGTVSPPSLSPCLSMSPPSSDSSLPTTPAFAFELAD